MVDAGRKVGDLLGQLGISAEVLSSRLDELGRASLARLQKLKLAYGAAALEGNRFGKAIADGRVNLPPFLWNPAPQTARTERVPFLGATYSALAPSGLGLTLDPFPGLLNPRTLRKTELSILIQSE